MVYRTDRKKKKKVEKSWEEEWLGSTTGLSLVKIQIYEKGGKSNIDTTKEERSAFFG